MSVELNFASTLESIAAAFPARPALLQAHRESTYADLIDRTRRLARLLEDHGLGWHVERAQLGGHELGQDTLAQYLHNGPEYLEGMLGAYRARVVPFNVNYRYVGEELRYLLADARPRAVQYHARFAPVLAEVLAGLGTDDLLLLPVADESGESLLPGALDYESALTSVVPAPGAAVRPDDAYLLYTGGTTGMPKGVIWRQADVAVAAAGVMNTAGRREWESLEEMVSSLTNRRPAIFLTCAPLIHGAAQWGALRTLATGGAIAFPSDARTFDAADVWDTVGRHGVTQISIVGDTFARNLVDELDRKPRSLPTLRTLISGGAPLQGTYKHRLLQHIPGLTLLETIGSSETGIQGRMESRGDAGSAPRVFQRDGQTVVVSEDRTSFLTPGHPGTGWIGSRGRVPLGYLGDETKTGLTFPVVDGVRVSLPGDRARLLEDGTIDLLGRDSMTINTGGEKVFAEEVEAAVMSHPAVADVAVCGRPSERWGFEVVAIIAWRGEARADLAAVQEACSDQLARYKFPKGIIVVDEVRRTAAGKIDYAWATELARASEVSRQ